MMVRAGQFRRRRAVRGYTLAELMVSLSIMAMVSTAISSLLVSANNISKSVKSSTSATSQMETAMARMIETTRSAADVQFDANGLYIQTPPDSNSYSYIYIYYVSNNQLREKVEYASSLAQIQDNVLVNNVMSFTTTQVNAAGRPRAYQLVVTAGPNPAISRTCVVTGRNL
jgi:prepilin-type N-terminal cleavage/methylation domain-containing protein